MLNKDQDILPDKGPLIILNSNYTVCIYKNGKNTKHIRHIDRKVHFVINGKK